MKRVSVAAKLPYAAYILSGAIACILTLGQRAAFADRLFDPLGNWQYTSEHSDGLVLDSTSPRMFGGDATRVKVRDGDWDGTIVYHLHAVSAASATICYWKNPGSVEFYASGDDVQWERVPSTVTPNGDPAPDWHLATLQTTQAMPADTSYLAIRIKSNGYSWTPQICDVTIDYTAAPPAGADSAIALDQQPAAAIDGSKTKQAAPKLPAPAGLTISCGSDRAYLDWFPVPGAISYNIERRFAASKDYKTLAAEVPQTDFMDTSIKPGVSYDYIVTANFAGQVGPPSDTVLAAAAPGTELTADALDDWGSTLSHTENLTLTDCDGGIECVKRTSVGTASFEYKANNASSFEFDALWNSGDLADAVTVDVSADGSTWTPVDIAPMLPPAVSKGGWSEAIVVPVGKLPANAGVIRISLGSQNDTSDESPMVNDIRIVSEESQAQSPTPEATPFQTPILQHRLTASAPIASPAISQGASEGGIPASH